MDQLSLLKSIVSDISGILKSEDFLNAHRFPHCFVRKEGLGVLLTLNNLIDTSPENGLVFRPLSPRLEMKMYLIWNKYQSFTPIAERFLKQIKNSFAR